MSMTEAEEYDLFELFRDRTESELSELATHFALKKTADKEQVVRLILSAKGRDARELKALQKEVRNSVAAQAFVSSLLEQEEAKARAETEQTQKVIASERAERKKRQKAEAARRQAEQRRRITDKHPLMFLIVCAREDPTIYAKLIAILRLDSRNRTSLLNECLNQLQLQKAPAGFQDAVALLTDDDVAAEALKMLTNQGNGNQ